MGRIAGVTAAETRERLLRAAADVFAERGYDGTRVADIAAAAGVSNGALYAHFPSKADLLVNALRVHGRHLISELFAADPDRPVVDLLLTVGRWLPKRRDARGYLIVEALVAARRDEDMAGPMREYVGERADWLSVLVGLAQTRGELDEAVSPDALAHFCLLLAMGSALITPDLHEVGEQEWAALLTRVAGALGGPGTPSRPGREDHDEGADRPRAMPGARPLLRPGAGVVRRGRGGVRAGPRRRPGAPRLRARGPPGRGQLPGARHRRRGDLR